MASLTSPDKFVCLQDFEDHALDHLNKNAADYYKSGANCEQTLKENREAFLRLRFRPRFLRDVTKRTFNTTVLGEPISFPVGVSPSAMQKLAHPEGEAATARATAAAGTVMILSTISTTSIEDVSKAAPDGLKWFQLYIYKDRRITSQLVKRAETSGYKALVLTVDTPMFGNRWADYRNKFTLPPHLRLANFDLEDVKSTGLRNTTSESSLSTYANSLFDPSISWDDIDWLRSITKLPIVAKGILTEEDAYMAAQHGVSGILVSNHGARQLDGTPATIEALPEIVRTVRGQCEVYLDGGVRTGTDVLKALALGARAVFIGRPVLWGLAHSGELGVKKVLDILKHEFDLAMALSGCASLEDVKPSLVVRQEYYSRL